MDLNELANFLEFLNYKMKKGNFLKNHFSLIMKGALMFIPVFCFQTFFQGSSKGFRFDFFRGALRKKIGGG